MSNKTKTDDGGPAFPSHEIDYRASAAEGRNVICGQCYGMSRRDYFAAQIMASMFNGHASDGTSPDVYFVCAREAVSAADALLAALKGS